MRPEFLRRITNPPRAERRNLPRLSAIAGIGALLITTALLSPVRPAVIVGTSMTPTLKPGQVVWCEQSPRQSTFHRGDVVLARVGKDVCVKRIFAVEGDLFWKTCGLRDDGSLPQLLDVGVPLAPWQARYPNFQFKKVRIPTGMVYLVGDGVNSIDSRRYGPVTASSLLGRVVYPRVPRNLEICEPSVWSSLPTRRAALPRS